MDQLRVPTNIERKPKYPSNEIVVQTDNNVLFLGLDKNTIMISSALLFCLSFSVYLFRELKMVREDVKMIKLQEPDKEITEKIEQNNESVKAIEEKLDQVISALRARDIKLMQMFQQQQQVQVSDQSSPTSVAVHQEANKQMFEQQLKQIEQAKIIKIQTDSEDDSESDESKNYNDDSDDSDDIKL